MVEEPKAPDYIPISHLNACAYCPRRFYYEFVLGEMVINEHVLEGQQLHERIDQPGKSTRGTKEQIRRLSLCAPGLGVIGYCDLIEVEREDEDVHEDLTTLAREHKVYPVEYKKGKMGKWLSDHTQLCVQALALEEVLGLPEESIQQGYIYYIGSARRDQVFIDRALRERTQTILESAHRIALQASPPEPLTNWRKCRDCSLEPICLPREVITLAKEK